MENRKIRVGTESRKYLLVDKERRERERRRMEEWENGKERRIKKQVTVMLVAQTVDLDVKIFLLAKLNTTNC